MADTLQFDLVSPERRLASLEAKAVRIPGAEGDMTAMPDHAPTITTLRPGILTVETASGDEEYLVTGGFAEIAAESTTVLAEAALPRAEVTQDDIDRFVAEAREASEKSLPETADSAAKLVNDMVAAGEAIGLRAN
ncbi:MAG: F0F1 ATP synthase subunit epsilon [Pseudomonadota bacterium]